MKEFSRNTYNKASTNKIVKDAGISKGLLFHYFSNKDKLYKYLEQFVIKKIVEDIVNQIDWEQTDIFYRLNEAYMIKLRLFDKYPYLIEFSTKVFKDKTVEEIFYLDPDFPLDLYSQIYTYNIDFSLFKEDINVKRAINIIRWTMEKYGEEYRRNIKDDEKINLKVIEEDLFKYINLLKKSFYRDHS